MDLRGCLLFLKGLILGRFLYHTTPLSSLPSSPIRQYSLIPSAAKPSQKQTSDWFLFILCIHIAAPFILIHLYRTAVLLAAYSSPSEIDCGLNLHKPKLFSLSIQRRMSSRDYLNLKLSIQSVDPETVRGKSIILSCHLNRMRRKIKWASLF